MISKNPWNQGRSLIHRVETAISLGLKTVHFFQQCGFGQEKIELIGEPGYVGNKAQSVIQEGSWHQYQPPTLFTTSSDRRKHFPTQFFYTFCNPANVDDVAGGSFDERTDININCWQSLPFLQFAAHLFNTRCTRYNSKPRCTTVCANIKPNCTTLYNVPNFPHCCVPV